MVFFWRVHCVSIIVVLCFSFSFRAGNEADAFQSRSQCRSQCRRNIRDSILGIQTVAMTSSSSSSSNPRIDIAACAIRESYSNSYSNSNININHPYHSYSSGGRNGDDIDTIDSQTDALSQSPRRQFLSASTTASFAFAALLGGMSRPRHAVAAAAATPAEDSARTQWKQAKTALDELLRDWSTEEWAAEVGGGDKVSTKLGTKGAVSPLYQIEKAFLKLRDSEFVGDDFFVEFQDAADDFMVTLYRADSLASSSNNKTGSGKQTPPAVFLEQSRAEVVQLQKIATKLDAMVK